VVLSLTFKGLALWQDVLLLFTLWSTKPLLSTSFRTNTPNENLAIRAKAAAKNNVAKTKLPPKIPPWRRIPSLDLRPPATTILRLALAVR
jgi:hypothetical protein